MKTDNTTKALLFIIAVGIWVNIITNYMATTEGTQDVRVVNTIDANISGYVNVGNEVDINISSVNGYRAKSYNKGLLGVRSN